MMTSHLLDESELAALRLPGFDSLVSGALGSRLAAGSPAERARLALYEQFAGREIAADERLRELCADASCPPEVARAARSLQRLGTAFEPEFAGDDDAIDWTTERPPSELDAVGIRERVAIAYGRAVVDGREPDGGWPSDFTPGDWAQQQHLIAECRSALSANLDDATLSELLEHLDLSVWVCMILLTHGEQRAVLDLVAAARRAHARHGVRVLEHFFDYLTGSAHAASLNFAEAGPALDRALEGFARAADRRWWMLTKAVQTMVASLTHSQPPTDLDGLERELLTGRWRHGRRSLGQSTLMLLSVALAARGDDEGARRLALAGGGPHELTVPATDRILLIESVFTSALADGDTDTSERMQRLADHMMASPLVRTVRDRMRSAALAQRNGTPPSPPPELDADPSIEILRTRWMILAQTVAQGHRAEAWSALAEFDAFAGRADAAAMRQRAVRLFHERAVAQDPTALSPRLLEVATLAASGLTNREIAARLFLGVRTVEGYVGEVLRALRLTRRSELAAVELAVRLNRPLRPAAIRIPLRQGQVGALIAAGASNGDVADALGVSEKTVDKHIVALKQRLGVSTRTEIAMAFTD